MKRPAIHKACGGIAALYTGDAFPPKDGRSADYERLDGSHPIAGEAFNERCPSCRKKIIGLLDLCVEDMAVML